MAERAHQEEVARQHQAGRRGVREKGSAAAPRRHVRKGGRKGTREADHPSRVRPGVRLELCPVQQQAE